MSRFVISRRSNGDYQFQLITDSEQIILKSEGYKTKQACKNGIQSIALNAVSENSFIRKTASNGKLYFVLKASNGETIGMSSYYASMSGREMGIHLVMRYRESQVEDAA
ncbi:MAG: YegP family protein [Bacteroidia bacterium]